MLGFSHYFDPTFYFVLASHPVLLGAKQLEFVHFAETARRMRPMNCKTVFKAIFTSLIGTINGGVQGWEMIGLVDYKILKISSRDFSCENSMM